MPRFTIIMTTEGLEAIAQILSGYSKSDTVVALYFRKGLTGMVSVVAVEVFVVTPVVRVRVAAVAVVRLVVRLVDVVAGTVAVAEIDHVGFQIAVFDQLRDHGKTSETS